MLLFRANDELTLLWRNAAHARMSSSEDRKVTGLGMFTAFPASDEGAASEAKAAIFRSVARICETGDAEEIGPYRFDLQGPDGDFVEHHWSMRMSPVVENGKVTAILQTAQDVTNSVLAKRLADSLKRAATTTAAVSYFSYDPETGRFDRSPAIDAMFGFAPDEAPDQATPFFERIHPDDLPGVHAEVARVLAAPLGELAAFDYRICLSDGGERFVRIRGEVAVDPEDRRQKLVGTFVDLTDIEENRRALARTVASREALVKEANHRIKNSLAVATSMLRIQKRHIEARGTIDPEEALDALRNTEARIHAVSNVHGLMQLSGTETSVCLKNVIDQLVTFSRDSSGLDAHQFDYTPLPLSIVVTSDSAVSIGLILNEMITNALKYGVDAEGGTRLSLTAETRDERCVVTLTNTIAEHTGGGRILSTQLGAILVEQFSRQIDATVETRSEDGVYTSRLSIPLASIRA